MEGGAIWCLCCRKVDPWREELYGVCAVGRWIHGGRSYTWCLCCRKVDPWREELYMVFVL